MCTNNAHLITADGVQQWASGTQRIWRYFLQCAASDREGFTIHSGGRAGVGPHKLKELEHN